MNIPALGCLPISPADITKMALWKFFDPKLIVILDFEPFEVD